MKSVKERLFERALEDINEALALFDAAVPALPNVTGGDIANHVRRIREVLRIAEREQRGEKYVCREGCGAESLYPFGYDSDICPDCHNKALFTRMAKGQANG